MDNRYKRLGKNTVLVFIGRAGSKLIGLIMMPFYTRFMSTSDYGVSDLIYTYSAIIVAIVSCCLADSIFIYPKDSDDEGRKKYYSSGFMFSILSFILCGLFFLFFYILNVKLELGGIFLDMIWWLFAFAASEFFQNYTQQFTRSIDKMKVYSLSGIVLTLSMALLALVLMPIYGLQGYLWSMVVAKMIAGLFTFFVSGSNKYFSIMYYDIHYLKQLLLYGIPLIPNGIMWWLVNGINRPIMEAALGLSAIGIYAVASKFPGILNMLFSIFSNAWGISMLEEFKKPDFNQFFNKTIKVLFFVTIIGGSFIVFGSKLLIKIFAAPEFLEAWKYMPLLTLGVILEAMSGLVGGVFAAEKKSKYFFYSSLWGAGVSLLLTWPFIKLWGLYGAALAIAASFFCMFMVRLVYAWKYINLFDIKYFASMLLLYASFIIVVIKDFGALINALCFVALLLSLFLIGKKELYAINDKLIKLRNK